MTVTATAKRRRSEARLDKLKARVLKKPDGCEKHVSRQRPEEMAATILPRYASGFLLLEHISKFHWIPEPNLPKCEPFHTRLVDTGSSLF
jgi:hypothetical protein